MHHFGITRHTKSMIASESSTEHFWEFQPNCMVGILPISHSVIAKSTIIHLIVPSIICIRGNMSWLIFSSVWKADTSLENIPQLCINCQLYTAWNASYKIHEILCIYNWRASSTSIWEIGGIIVLEAKLPFLSNHWVNFLRKL